MPRKRSTSGRARKVTMESRIYLQAEKINRKIRSLEKGKNFGRYKSKELISFVGENTYLGLKRRGRRKNKLVVGKLRGVTFGSLALISKKFKNIIKSKSFSNVGIADIEEKSRESLKKTLKGLTDKDITDKDLETFYDIVTYKKNEIIDKVKPSDFYNIVNTASEKNYDVDEWLDLLQDYITINNEDLRKSAKKLYNKFVKFKK